MLNNLYVRSIWQALATLLVILAGGKPAASGVCIVGGVVGTFSCSGAANAGTDATNGGLAAPLFPGIVVNMSTTAGFGLDTTSNGFNIIGTGGASFVDNHNATISGHNRGVRVRNESGGGIVITTTGTVTGVSNHGIQAEDVSDNSAITINAVNINGGFRGIEAVNSGTGTTSVTVSGVVTGGTGAAIQAYAVAGEMINVTLNTGADVSSSQGTAIINNESDSTVIVNSGASVTGVINLGDGSDSLTFNGGDFSAVTNFDGGTGTDTLTFRNVSGEVTNSKLTGFEALNIGAGATMTMAGDFEAAVTVENGGSITGGISLGDGTGEVLTVNAGGSITGDVFARGGQDTLSVAGGTFVGNIDMGAQQDAVLVTSGGTITGGINLSNGADTLTFDGAGFSGVTSMDGGAGGHDVVTFRNTSGTIASNVISNFEHVVIESGANISLNGTLEGDVAVNSGASVSAGNSPGLLNIMGNLDLGVSLTTLFELAGLTPGVELGGYDVIDVTDDVGTGGAIEGIATIADGAIFDIDFFAGFLAGLGDTFDLLVADTINVVDFDSWIFDFSDAALAANLGWNMSLHDLGNGRSSVRLEVVSSQVPEPGTLLVLISGILVVVMVRHFGKKCAFLI